MYCSRLIVSLDKILTLGNKNKQVCFVLLSLNRIFATQNKDKKMKIFDLPKKYKPLLDLKQTELAIKQIKETFQNNLSSTLSLRRVTLLFLCLEAPDLTTTLTAWRQR